MRERGGGAPCLTMARRVSRLNQERKKIKFPPVHVVRSARRQATKPGSGAPFPAKCGGDGAAFFLVTDRGTRDWGRGGGS
jgi:hypothetical protein